jgi:DMSO reductase anchor subunit
MATESPVSLHDAGYAAGSVTKAPDWHGLVAWDLLLNNLTTGLFLVAALGDLLLPDRFTPTAKAAYPLALVLLLADLTCLVLDLGDPLRFHHMLRVFKPTSPMSLGTWCLTIYSLPLTVAAALSLWPADGPVLDWLRKIAVVLAVLPALGSAAYKGVLLSTNAQPGWRDARWLGGYLTNSAFLLGSAAMLALAALREQESAITPLRPALMLLLVLNLVPLGLLTWNLRPALFRAYTSRQLASFAALVVGVGTLLPLALLLVAESRVLEMAAVLFLLLGSLAVRFVIVRLPHAYS